MQPIICLTDLPNANYINLIITNFRDNIDNWAATQVAESKEVNELWRVVIDAIGANKKIQWDDLASVISTATSDSKKCNAFRAVKSSILALIMYDCAYLLNEDSKQVLIFKCLGSHAASLLYPACSALSNSKPQLSIK